MYELADISLFNAIERRALDPKQQTPERVDADQQNRQFGAKITAIRKPMLEAVKNLAIASRRFNKWYIGTHQFLRAFNRDIKNKQRMFGADCQLYKQLVGYGIFGNTIKPNAVLDWCSRSPWFRQQVMGGR